MKLGDVLPLWDGTVMFQIFITTDDRQRNYTNGISPEFVNSHSLDVSFGEYDEDVDVEIVY